MSKTFCLYPFTHIEIFNNGDISPCCRFDGPYRFEGQNANILKNDIESVLNSPHAIEIRKALLTGKKYKSCHRCWRDEELGLKSQRLRYNQRFINYINSFTDFSEYQILSFDLKFGNTCNQMCMICGPMSSSMIASEEKNIFNIKNFNLDWYRDDEIMEKLYKYLDSILHIEFYGGEPWIIKQQWKLLEQLINLGLSHKITLNYATNGSVFEDRYFTDIFSKFKKVSILLSADGIEDTFEYSRYPGKWKNFESNLKNMLQYANKNITFSIGYTVSSYSVFNITDSLEYYSSVSNDQNNLKVWFNLVGDERSMIKNLPDDLKEILINDLNNNWKNTFPTMDKFAKDALLKEINKDRNINGWNDFLNYTKNKDNLRNINIGDSIKVFKKYF